MSDPSIPLAADGPPDEAAEALGLLISEGEPNAEPPLPVEEGPRRGLLVGLAAIVGVALLWMLFRAVPEEAPATAAPAAGSRTEIERMADAADPGWMRDIEPARPATGARGVVPPPFDAHGGGSADEAAADGTAVGSPPAAHEGSGAGEDPRRQAFQAALRSRPALAPFSSHATFQAGPAHETGTLPPLAAMEAEAMAEAIRRSEAVSPGGAVAGMSPAITPATTYGPAAGTPTPAMAGPGLAVLVGRSGGERRDGLVLPAGTVIEGQLHTEVNSDLPGSVVGIVTRDVFDADQRVVVIPRHSWLVGTYESDVATGQVRLVVRWTTLRLPDGERFDLPHLRAGDPTGASGLPGRVNNHYGRIFGHALLTSVIGAGGILVDRSEPSDPRSARGAVAEATAQQMLQTSSEVTRRNLAIKPTIVVPRLTRFSILLDRDLLFVRAPAGAGAGR
jgi:type IV secretory pathway VirB10-like protein